MTHLDHRDQPPAPVPPAREPEPEGSSPIRIVLLLLVVAWVGLVGGLPWVVILFALVTVIFLHELGHYLTAKWAGMKVTEFFIGFGPRIWSFHRGETEYGIKAIPAGAYVKVIGMTNLEEVDPADESRTYRQKPYWRRMSVAVAGSTMHFIIAIVAMYALLVGFGQPTDEQLGWSIDRLAAIHEDGEEDGEQTVGPAEAAGLEVGDRVVAVDGRPITLWDELVDEVQGRQPADVVVLTVERGGQTLDLDVTLGDNGEGDGFLGVGPEVEYRVEEVGVVEAIPTAFVEFGDITWQSLRALGSFFSPSGLSEFVGTAADTATSPSDGPTSAATAAAEGENRVLSIYGAARLGAQAADSGVEAFLAFMVLINVFIGAFNLVPLLPLDGGHVAVATYEKVRELASRSRDRYHADVNKLMPLTYGVVFLLVGVGLVALYLDIANPIDL
ncbi:M50 family metallopeptidase [Actinomarinicola tropica]|uniref:PDZ domain-containing protein n=1 Tax=Actinomarinicola tropica TaxID=2789776 RepID=A0A5Q2RLC8_9ACTN|nr:site-2 protease family protein [Actinomarinicola tropica]QGG94867.1 PDZ domain-containing protein [Actinomarinicola tropica]